MECTIEKRTNKRTADVGAPVAAGDPVRHISMLKENATTGGAASLQNALEEAYASLWWETFPSPPLHLVFLALSSLLWWITCTLVQPRAQIWEQGDPGFIRWSVHMRSNRHQNHHQQAQGTPTNDFPLSQRLFHCGIFPLTSLVLFSEEGQHTLFDHRPLGRGAHMSRPCRVH